MKGFLRARLGQETPERPSFKSRSSLVYQGQPYVLEVNFQSDALLRFEPWGGEGSLPFNSAGDGSFLIGALDLDGWLGGIPVAACLESGDLTLAGNILRLETGQNSCQCAAELMKSTIESSGVMSLSFRP